MAKFCKHLLGMCALLAMIPWLACGSDDEDKSGGSGDDLVKKACNIIVVDCGGAAEGINMIECLNDLERSPFRCVQCVVDSGCNYEDVCHDPSEGCDLK